MIGPEINSLCILFGAVIGSFVGRLLGETFRRHLLLVFGCINIGMGIFMIGKTQALPPVVCALLLGALAGEMLRLEHIIMLVAHKTASAFSRIGKKQRSSLEYMREQFSIFLVVFAASGLGFFGAMQEGLTKDPSLLIIKALLDFPTALLIAANTGTIIDILCVHQFPVQTLLLFRPESSDNMPHRFSSTTFPDAAASSCWPRDSVPAASCSFPFRACCRIFFSPCPFPCSD